MNNAHHTYKTLLAAALVALGTSACSNVDIPVGAAEGGACDDVNICGEGLVCNAESQRCEAAYNNRHGVFPDKIVLGTSLATTGSVRDLGIGMLDGMSAYFNYVNKDLGGVHGREIELLVLDDGYEPAQAKQNVEIMTNGSNRKVFAVIGNMGSPTAAVTVPVLNDNKVVLFAPYTGAAPTRKDPPDKYIFNFRASYQDEAEGVTKYLLNVREPAISPENIAVFAQADDKSPDSDWNRLDAYGLEGFLGAAKALKAAKEIEKADVFLTSYPHNTAVVDDAVKQLLRWMVDPDRIEKDGRISVGIVMQTVAAPGTAFTKLIKDELANLQKGQNGIIMLSAEELERIKKVDLVLVSTSPIGDKMPADLKVLQSADKNYCEGIIVSQVVPDPGSTASGVEAFRKHLKEYDTNLIEGYVNLEGYIAARLFTEALQRAGKDLTDQVLIDTLHKMRPESVGGEGTADVGIGVTLEFSGTQHQASNKIWGSVLDKDCAYGPFDLEQ